VCSISPCLRKWVLISNCSYIEVAELILERPEVDVTVANNFCLRRACFGGYLDVVKMLLSVPGVDLNDYDPTEVGSSALCIAALKGDADIVDILLADPRIDATACNSMALLKACESGNAEVVKILLADGRCDPAADDSATIRAACSTWRSIEIVSLLMDDGRANPCARNYEAFMSASALEHIKLLFMLFEDDRFQPTGLELFNIMMNNSSRDTMTPEIYDKVRQAAIAGHAAYAQCFFDLRPGFDLTHNDSFAFKFACTKGNTDVVQMFLQRFPEVDAGCGSNYAIREAARKGHMEIFCMLLMHHSVDPSGCSNEAIRMASQNGHYRVVQKLLLDSRVDPTANGNAAFKAAKKNRHINLVHLLLSDDRVMNFDDRGI
jgi:ankyrin repeat protein